MIEDDPLDTMNIQHIKLSDGSEIVAYINSTEGNFIVAERPMLINSVKTTNGFDTYYFTNYMPFAKVNLIKLNSRNVISASEVNTDIKDKYVRAALQSNSEDKFDNNTTEEMNEEDMDLNFMESPSKKLH
jgi:hypothetical protein